MNVIMRDLTPHFRFPVDAVQGAVMDSLGKQDGLAKTILRDEQIRERFVRLLLDEILRGRESQDQMARS